MSMPVFSQEIKEKISVELYPNPRQRLYGEEGMIHQTKKILKLLMLSMEMKLKKNIL